MPVEYKDYYGTLGVARTAHAEEIRKAFRRLARECHPDIATHQPDGEARFKEINEAYEVLSDPEKRQTYDRFSTTWTSNAGPRVHNDAQRGPTFEFRFGGTGFSAFFEQLFGAASADRSAAGTPEAEPVHDGERGEDVESDILVSLHEAMHGSVRPISLQRKIPCPQCYGTGSVNASSCTVCHGEGDVTKRDQYQVRVPAGVREGHRLRLRGQGDAGPRHGARGDLYLRVRFAQHPDFKFQGPHLLHELDLAPWEAVLGTQITIPTLSGKMSIRVPAGSQHGQRLRVREQGLPATEGPRGDLLVQLRIQIPRELTEREKALWVQIAAEAATHSRSNETASTEAQR